MSAHVIQLGQVFTPPAVVRQVMSLCKNLQGRVLEPSAGDGAFSREIPGCVALELDARVAPPGAVLCDFFDYPDSEQFDCIIGNPPFVAYRDIQPETKAKLDESLFDQRANLFLHFIAKSLRHLKPGGELCFIVPRELAKLTAAKQLNALLYASGSITDVIELGDAPVFAGYSPNCIIFRFEKGRRDRRMSDGRTFVEREGQLLFLAGEYPVPFSELFDVKVGAVSGADPIFTHPEGAREFVCSQTAVTGATRRMLFDQPEHPVMQANKDVLLARRIRPFGEHNWWQWGRMPSPDNRPRIYVNAKTRRAAPFFCHPCMDFDGSVLAVMPRNEATDLAQACALLNAVDWADLGFMCDGRYLFSQRALATAALPASFLSLLR